MITMLDQLLEKSQELKSKILQIEDDRAAQLILELRSSFESFFKGEDFSVFVEPDKKKIVAKKETKEATLDLSDNIRKTHGCWVAFVLELINFRIAASDKAFVIAGDIPPLRIKEPEIEEVPTDATSEELDISRLEKKILHMEARLTALQDPVKVEWAIVECAPKTFHGRCFVKGKHSLSLTEVLENSLRD